MTLLVTNMDRESAAYNAKMETVNEELDHMDLPAELASRIRKYFHTMWTFNRSVFKVTPHTIPHTHTHTHRTTPHHTTRMLFCV